ncbi:unnamed protein product [Brachionus calyciflorus]|uniref:Uncharacterized protein n=1 Tax=Brachionus calyciflorus TaxID=104777 RepID=A0A814EER2_9BILA|nr:unnamed protein product [Brachionus calyciflorus]
MFFYNKTIAVKHVPERHTTISIKDNLNQVLKYWGISENLVSIVSDHANNMMGLADLLNSENDQELRDFNENLLKRKEIKQFGCAAHL